MKKATVQVTLHVDADTHREIKLAAAKSGLFLKDFFVLSALVAGRNNIDPAAAIKALEDENEK